MLKFFSKYWFAIVFGTLFGLYAVFLIIIAFSPRADAQNRGFIPCTIKLTENLENCASKGAWCYIKKIAQNNACDFKVIVDGFSLWMKGEQKAPWSNYYFTPIEPENPDFQNKELQEVYENNAKILQEMEELNAKRIELETKLDGKEQIENDKLKDHINQKEKAPESETDAFKELEKLTTGKNNGENKNDNEK